MSEQKSKYKESAKIHIDFLKHITTLSTGSLILLVAMLEKLFTEPKAVWSLIVSLLSFLSAILLSVTSFIFLAIAYQFWERGDEPRDFIDTSAGILYLLSYISFASGVIFLTVFAINNLIK